MQRKNLYKVKKIENSTTTAYSVPFRGPAQDSPFINVSQLFTYKVN